MVKRALVTLSFAVAALNVPGAPAHAQASLTGKALDPVPEEILLEILEAAGLRSARVSSYHRTARKQAEIMYGICRARRGVTKARRTYSAVAERIIDVYVANRKLKRERVIDLMTAETRRILQELGPGRTTLMHVDSRNYTFDVAPSSIGKRNRKRFAAAIKNHPDVIRVLEPGVGSERAYHIEIARTQASLRGAWIGACAIEGARTDTDTDTDTEPLVASLNLDKSASHYRGTLVLNAEVSEWHVRVDRRARTMHLSGAGHDLSGALSNDYRSLTLTLGPLVCVLDKPSDEPSNESSSEPSNEPSGEPSNG